MQIQFIGRKYELQRLNDVFKMGQACVTTITGRRRIGKSRLIQEFSQGKRFLSFTGLAPIEGITAQSQRDAFAMQLADFMKTQPKTYTDWTAAFNDLASHLTKEPTVILLDEISWMASDDHTFVPKLKNLWDLKLQQKSNLMLVFCGSVSTWIEKNIIRSTAFFGRITLHLDLEPLSIAESALFLRTMGFKASLYDICTILAIMGGVPWYLEKISRQYTTSQNIKNLCFEPRGLLVKEFDSIFHDLFNGHGSTYKRIVYLLADGMKDSDEIKQALDLADVAMLETCMHDLVTAGFVSKHAPWSFTTGKAKEKESLYRLCDNYLRFYIKYIEPRMSTINQKKYRELSVQSLPGWDAMMGFQLETLLLNNRPTLLKALGLDATEIIADNPYIQRGAHGERGCQIDYLIQTRTKTLFVCEFKFVRRELGMGIIRSMREKIKSFSVPHGYGIVPVLFHFEGVTPELDLDPYFYRMIDITKFLKPETEHESWE